MASHGQSMHVPGNKRVVYIWDLDETLILFKALADLSFAKHEQKDKAVSLKLAELVEARIFDLLDNRMHFNEIENFDRMCVSDAGAYDDGRPLATHDFAADGFGSSTAGLPSAERLSRDQWRLLAYRYRHMRQLYSAPFLGTQELMKRIDLFSDRWLSASLDALRTVAQAPAAENVLVTASQLSAAIAKLLIYGLSDYVPIDNIYSSSSPASLNPTLHPELSKRQCFDRIRKKYGEHVTYVVIGDGQEEEECALVDHMQFVPIHSATDMQKLALQLHKQHPAQ